MSLAIQVYLCLVLHHIFQSEHLTFYSENNGIKEAHGPERSADFELKLKFRSMAENCTLQLTLAIEYSINI